MSTTEFVREHWKVIVPTVAIVLALIGGTVRVETQTDRDLGALTKKVDDYARQSVSRDMASELQMIRWQIEDVRRIIRNAQQWQIAEDELQALREQLRLLREREQQILNQMRSG